MSEQSSEVKTPMSRDRAKEITKQCCASTFAMLVKGDHSVDLPDCSLEEMLEANRIIGRDRGEKQPDGSTSIQMNVDPRGLAARYAFEHFGKSPHALLEALGFTLSDDEDA